MTAKKIFALRALLLGSVFCLSCAAARANPASPAPAPTIPALMISDIHFDPFHDPAKVSALAAAPVSGWQAILAAPDSATQPQAYAALLKNCGAKAEDTPYALLASALQSVRRQATGARFITLSGDLLAHKFNCRFAQTMPKATPAEYDSFVEKTMQFEAEKLHAALPRATLYLALGNNDSNCEDYKLDTGTPFLAAVGKLAGRMAGPAWNAAAAKDFATGGYYSVTMAAPMQHTRLIVVNDIFLSPGYAHCSGQADPAPGAAQMQWLQQQLDAARKLHQRVWVMGHIPPGVNPYSTLSRGPAAVCGGRKASMFLASEALGDTLAGNASAIQLAIFAHTHMDELRLLTDPSAPPGTAGVALKMVPSISPVNGNYPAFMVARVNPATAELQDYTVIAATDAEGSAWKPESTFSTAYGHTGFTAETLRAVIAGFAGDPAAAQPASRAYLDAYATGAPTRELSPLWPAYVCALTHTHPADYTACVCEGK